MIPVALNRLAPRSSRPSSWKAPVLDDHRHVVDAVAAREAGRAGRRVVEDEHAGEPAVHVLGGPALQVRVIPERRGRLIDLPARRPSGARRDHLMRAAVHPRRQVHAVPMHRGRLADRVLDVHEHPLAAPGAQRRPEVGAVHAVRRRAYARAKLGVAAPGGEIEDPPALRIYPRSGERGNLQRPGEPDLPGRVQVGALIEHRGGHSAHGNEHDDEAGGGERDPSQATAHTLNLAPARSASCSADRPHLVRPAPPDGQPTCRRWMRRALGQGSLAWHSLRTSSARPGSLRH